MNTEDRQGFKVKLICQQNSYAAVCALKHDRNKQALPVTDNYYRIGVLPDNNPLHRAAFIIN
jgi:hypothetical protein